MKSIYLDNAATTKVLPEVKEKLIPFLTDNFGNPSSIHSFGRKVRVAIEDARETIASIIGADSSEIYFTSGGTEANNFIINGIAKSNFEDTGKKEIVTSPVEHKAVLDSFAHLENDGFAKKYLEVLPSTQVDTDKSKELLNQETSLVSAMFVNNETGAINNISAISDLAKENGALFHVDAVQAFCKIDFKVEDLGVDALSGSAHKIGGLKGAGFAYIKNQTPMQPLINGGGQERNRRGGTENVVGIISLAEAAKIAYSRLNESKKNVANLKELLIKNIKEFDSENIHIINGNNFSPYVINVIVKSNGYKNDPEAMLMFMDINGVAVSSGSACTSGTWKPSHVISKTGLSEADARGAIRFSFSPYTTENDVNDGIKIFKKMLNQIKK